MTNPAALYLRVSTRQQAEEGFSLEDQQRTLTALANERGWPYRLYVDAGLSGEHLHNRPALLEMLTNAAAGQHQIVAVVDESRLARDELTAAIIRDRLKRAGVTLVTPGRGAGPCRPFREFRRHRPRRCCCPGTRPTHRQDRSRSAGHRPGGVLAGWACPLRIPSRT